MLAIVFLEPSKMKDWARSLALGMTVILSIGGCFGLGWLLDRAVKTTPTFMVAGLVLGTVLAFQYLYVMAKRK